MVEIEKFLSTQGECKVEIPQDYQAYRLSGVPRSYQGFNGSTMESIEITAKTVAEALEEVTNVAPVKVLEIQGTPENQYFDHRNWIVLYPRGSKLSRSLPLFGVRISSKPLPKRTRIPQCGKCFGWHNERSCARAPRCRLCGSTKHTESGHVSCDPTRPHACPPKCANCHGPHPADSLECLIRPNKDNILPSKTQMAQIRQAAAASRFRLIAVHCKVLGQNDLTSQSQNLEDAPVLPSTPPTIHRLFSDSPSPTSGRYAVLSQPSHECSQSRMHEE